MTLAHLGPLPWEELGLDNLIWIVPVVATWLFYRGLVRLKGMSDRGWRLVAFVGAMAIAFAVVSPPMERTADALFSVHMVQHLFFLVAIPVLLVYSRAGRCLVAGFPVKVRKGTVAWRRRAMRDIPPMVTVPLVALAFGAVLWAWHLPALYDAAVRNEVLHEFEHASMLGVALLFWTLVLDSRRAFLERAILIFATGFQSGLLGAILLFASHPLYQVHVTQQLWAVDPLTDQQIAGGIMWMLMGGVYLATLGVLIFGRLGVTKPKTREPASAH